MRWKDYRLAREKMVREQLYDRGISDSNVLDVMLRIPRHVFLDPGAGSEAYSDHSFPIGFSQTMTQPYMVGFLCEQLNLTGDDRVLEIGTGSGYQAAVLAGLCRDVFTVERVPELAEKARRVLQNLLCSNVTIMAGNGLDGWDKYAPFDRILFTAAPKKIPMKLLTQLKDGGMLVGPVENGNGAQEIVRLTRIGTSCTIDRLGSCSFVPMVQDETADAENSPVRSGETYGR